LGGTKDVKVDITKGEKFSYALEEKTIFREYSDLEEVYSLNCYSLSEIVIEKMVALMGRTIARDLYDLWYLFYKEDLDIIDYIWAFKDKAIHKGHEPSTFTEKVSNKSKSLKGQWGKSLSSQIHDLPDFDDVWREINKHLRKFNKNYE
jgi:predicted nucleotidyltransferase component of viral defense system